MGGGEELDRSEAFGGITLGMRDSLNLLMKKERLRQHPYSKTGDDAPVPAGLVARLAPVDWQLFQLLGSIRMDPYTHGPGSVPSSERGYTCRIPGTEAGGRVAFVVCWENEDRLGVGRTDGECHVRVRPTEWHVIQTLSGDGVRAGDLPPCPDPREGHTVELDDGYRIRF